MDIYLKIFLIVIGFLLPAAWFAFFVHYRQVKKRYSEVIKDSMEIKNEVSEEVLVSQNNYPNECSFGVWTGIRFGFGFAIGGFAAVILLWCIFGAFVGIIINTVVQSI